MDGIAVRRVIPSDNSCVFNAVGFIMDHDKHKAQELRQVIAATVSSDPEKYNEVFLGKSNASYCQWILDNEKWGVHGRPRTKSNLKSKDWSCGSVKIYPSDGSSSQHIILSSLNNLNPGIVKKRLFFS